MRRRNFITLLSGTAVARFLPAHVTVRAQQAPMKRVGVLMGAVETDLEYQARIKAFQQSLAALGWIEGSNIHLNVRWGIGDADIRGGAAELVGLSPDVLLSNAPPAVLALQKLTDTIPIVFVAVTDPVILGVVQNLAPPGGNITGFTSAEVALSGKWLELLKEIAPDVRRAAVFAPPSNLGAQAQIGAIQAVAPSLQVELNRITVGELGTMERAVSALAGAGNGGLIVSRTAETFAARDLIISLAAKYRLPAVYPDHLFITSGGLASYGTDLVDDFRKAARYVDRILKGEKPSDLPVQVPTEYKLAINQKTAKALGLAIPPSLVARADEVIE
jgi:putative ABC transport system substrate-binding protein